MSLRARISLVRDTLRSKSKLNTKINRQIKKENQANTRKIQTATRALGSKDSQGGSLKPASEPRKSSTGQVKPKKLSQAAAANRINNGDKKLAAENPQAKKLAESTYQSPYLPIKEKEPQKTEPPPPVPPLSSTFIYIISSGSAANYNYIVKINGIRAGNVWTTEGSVTARERRAFGYAWDGSYRNQLKAIQSFESTPNLTFYDPVVVTKDFKKPPNSKGGKTKIELDFYSGNVTYINTLAIAFGYLDGSYPANWGWNIVFQNRYGSAAISNIPSGNLPPNPSSKDKSFTITIDWNTGNGAVATKSGSVSYPFYD